MEREKSSALSRVKSAGGLIPFRWAAVPRRDGSRVNAGVERSTITNRSRRSYGTISFAGSAEVHGCGLKSRRAWRKDTHRHVREAATRFCQHQAQRATRAEIEAQGGKIIPSCQDLTHHSLISYGDIVAEEMRCKNGSCKYWNGWQLACCSCP